MFDESDFIRKIYDSEDKRRIQKWFMRYCDNCQCKLTYLPKRKTCFCASCSSLIKFAKKSNLELTEYLSLAPTRALNDKIATRLRNRLNRAIELTSKTGSAVTDLGCSIDEFRIYLESKFQPGMSWDNHAIDGWHIDHIIPLASFNLSDYEQLKLACHYTNMQPMWWRKNLSKGKK